MGWLSDLGNAVASGASAVGDVVEDVVDTVADTVEDAADTVVDGVQSGLGAASDWLCENAGSAGCAVGNVVLGGISGLVRGAQDLLHDALDIVRDVGGLVGSLLSLDIPGFLRGLGRLVLDVLDLAIDGLRFALGGYLVGGIVDRFHRSMLIEFVRDLVRTRFGSDPVQLAAVRRRIGLEGGRRFGFRLPAEHRVFLMDSDSVPLWQMHENGVLDLYAMAHRLSFDSFALGAAHPNTIVKSVSDDGSESWMPVGRYTIAKYLESQGRDRRLRVYAMDRRTTAMMLDTAHRKLEELGVIVEWNDSTSFSWFNDYTSQPITQAEYDFNSAQIEQLLGRPEYNRPPGLNCSMVALAGFKLDIFGRVGARLIAECDDFPTDCATPGRSDRCCNTIDRCESSGVIYRDAYPSDLFSYVLAHEAGHYLGLCHCGHDGFHNVMFSKRATSFFDWGLLSLYYESEPSFSLADGKNAWRFIADQMASCLTGVPEPACEPDEVVPKVSALSCAVPKAGGPRRPVIKHEVDAGILVSNV